MAKTPAKGHPSGAHHRSRRRVDARRWNREAEIAEKLASSLPSSPP
jgi:hypothetical protein